MREIEVIVFSRKFISLASPLFFLSFVLGCTGGSSEREIPESPSSVVEPVEQVQTPGDAPAVTMVDWNNVASESAAPEGQAPAVDSQPLDDGLIDEELVARLRQRATEYERRDLVKLSEANTSRITLADYRKRQQEISDDLLLGSFRRVGKRDERWTADAEKFISASGTLLSEKAQVPSETVAELAKTGERLRAAGCDDPLVILLNAVVLMRRGTADAIESARHLTEDALKGLASRGFPERTQLIAALLRARIIGNYRGAIGQQREQFLNEAIPHVVGAATQAGDDLLDRRIALDRLSSVIESNLIDQHAAIVKALTADSRIDPWLRTMLIGRIKIRLAWNLRKNRTENMIPAGELAAFHNLMREARAELVRAWELVPEAPEAAAELIGVRMASGDIAGETTRFWFDESVSAQFDFPLAYERYLWSIRPSWGGSHQQLLDFGRECLATNRFDTEVPWKFHLAVEYVRGDLSEKDEIYLQDGIYDSYRVLIAGYRDFETRPKGKEWRDTQLASIAWLSGRREEAAEILTRLGSQAEPEAALTFHTTLNELRRGLRLESGEVAESKENPFGHVVRVAVRDDGTQRIVAVNREILSAWEVSGTARRKLFSDALLPLTRIAISLDGSRLAHLATPSRVRVWNVDTAEMVDEFAVDGPVNGLHFSRDGKRLAVSGWPDIGRPFLQVWSMGPLRQEAQLPRFDDADFLLPTISPDGKRLLFVTSRTVAAGGVEMHVGLWDLEAQSLIWRVPAPLKEQINALAFVPDGSGVICAGFTITGEPRKQRRECQIATLAIDSGRQTGAIEIRNSYLHQLSFVDDNHLVIGATTDGSIVALNLATGEELARYIGHDSYSSIALNAERTKLVSGGSEGLFEWPIQRDSWRSQFRTRYPNWTSRGSPSSLRASSDGRRVMLVDINVGAAIWDMRHPENSRIVTAPYPAELSAASLSPDGRSLAGIVVHPERQTSETWLWDLETGAVRWRLTGHASAVRRAVLTPDSRMLITAATDADVIVWDVERGVPFPWGWLREHQSSISDLALSPDGTMLVSAGWDGTVRVWDLPQKPDEVQKELLSRAAFTGFGREGTYLAFSNDGKRLAVSSADSTTIYDTSGFRRLHVIPGAAACFTFDSKLVATGGGPALGTEARLYDVATGIELRRFQGGHREPIQGLAFSPDGELLITESLGSPLKYWKTQDGSEIVDLANSLGNHWSEALQPSVEEVATASVPAVATEPADLMPRLTFRGHESPVWCVSVSPDGRSVVSGSGRTEGPSDNSLRVWDPASGVESRKFSGHTSRALSASFAPQGTLVVSGSQDGKVCLWDSASGDQIREWSDPGAQIVRFMPSGKEFLAGGQAMVTLRSVDPQEQYRVRSLANDAVWCTAISRSGQTGLTCGGGAENTIRTWDLVAGRPLRKLSGHTGWVEAVSFVGDGRMAISGSHDGTLRLWDVPHARCLRVLTGHRGAIFCVAVSRTGKYVLSGGVDGILRLWDLDNDHEMIRGQGHSADIRSVAFSPDERFAVSGSVDGTVCVWDLPALERTE